MTAALDLRPARCPSCGHCGAVPRSAPTITRLRCSACGERVLVRHVVGPRPARFSHRRSAKAVREAAAAEVLARFEPSDLDDDVADLFGSVSTADRGGPVAIRKEATHG